MDEKKKVTVAGKTTCACGPECSCGCGSHYAHRVLWWLLAIVIIAIAFCVGVKAGEFREELRSMYGNYYHGYPMMQPRGYNPGGVAVPVTTGASGSATGTVGSTTTAQ